MESASFKSTLSTTQQPPYGQQGAILSSLADEASLSKQDNGLRPVQSGQEFTTLCAVTAMTKKMLERRHYNYIEFTEDDKCGKKPRFVASKEDDEVTVFFIEHNKVTIQVIKSIIAITKTKHVIIIYAFSLTPDAKQSVNTESPFQFEIFSFDEMSYDPIEIVPPHKKVVNKPIEWNKLPIILTSDIIARYYWFKHGDVIAIDENDFTSYRKCIKII